MSQRFAELAFTPLVKKQQEKHGSRRQYARMQEIGEPGDRLTDFEREFIAGRELYIDPSSARAEYLRRFGEHQQADSGVGRLERRNPRSCPSAHPRGRPGH